MLFGFGVELEEFLEVVECFVGGVDNGLFVGIGDGLLVHDGGECSPHRCCRIAIAREEGHTGCDVQFFEHLDDDAAAHDRAFHDVECADCLEVIFDFGSCCWREIEYFCTERFDIFSQEVRVTT